MPRLQQEVICDRQCDDKTDIGPSISRKSCDQWNETNAERCTESGKGTPDLFSTQISKDEEQKKVNRRSEYDHSRGWL